jgi:hypothetical protein
MGAGLTSGGPAGASGGKQKSPRRPALLAAAVYAAFGLVYLVVNATSVIDERRALGRPVEAWQPWVWESTSFAAWLLLLPGVLWLAGRVRFPKRPWRAAAIHLAATVPFSLAHTGAMFVLRALAYGAAGEAYRLSGPLLDVAIYEYRKDAVTYAAIVLAFWVVRRLALPPGGPEQVGEALIEVRDGSRVMWLKPEEVDWVSAAGNYVELHGAFGTRLARRTLAELETELAPCGFVRVHRSRLVRKAAVAATETRQSGDFAVTLRSGAAIGGSRRYRTNLSG